MRRPVRLGTLALALLAGACTDNHAPGNDREAELDPPGRPAPTASAAEALQGIAPALVVPQTLTGADLGALPGTGRTCLFSYTRVGLPIVAYGEGATLKLNGKLVPLPATGEGRYAEGGASVTLRPRGDDGGAGEPFEAEMVFRLEGVPDELGFHGFSRCEGAAG